MTQITQKTSLPFCQQEKQGCFANIYGKCICLDNTRFMKRCPFYKTKEQVDDVTKGLILKGAI